MNILFSDTYLYKVGKAIELFQVGLTQLTTGTQLLKKLANPLVPAITRMSVVYVVPESVNSSSVELTQSNDKKGTIG